VTPPVGRFAPTPSGQLHLGNALCAMLAYLSVRAQGGTFLLRIEDVDVPRCPPRLARQCLEDLAWLGLRWDAPPLYQSQRGDVYAAHAEELTRRGLTYPCFCTRAALHAEAAPNLGDTQQVYRGTCAFLSPEEIASLSRLRRPALRLRVPDEEYTFTDRLCGVVRENLKRECGDFVLRRSDGLWGYQLAVVVDDALSGVTEVVRGRDILTATPRQLYLQRLFGFPQPEYCHIPLLTDAFGRRLAKRAHDTGLTALREHASPEAVLGLLSQACGLQEEAAPVSMEALIPLFDWEKVNEKGDTLRLSAQWCGNTENKPSEKYLEEKA